MSEPRTKLDPRVFDRDCRCGSDSCAVCEGLVKPEDIASDDWFDNKSAFSELPSPSIIGMEAPVPIPGSLAYLEQGLDELYVSLGGEG